MAVILAEKYKLVEKPHSEGGSSWRALHIIIYCMAFVFGGFCSFFFHMLMYMFEGKCVLFPQLRSFYFSKEFEATLNERERNPLDFVTTIWQDGSTCLFPVYLPLLSSISGLVWTAMFLLSGNGVVAGFQRSWWVLPFSFLFSLVMGCLCLYTSIVSHMGLRDLCFKISKINHSVSCDLPLTLITALYEKRITKLNRLIIITILTSWCNTICWIVSIILIVARVCLVIDFQLVKVTVELRGNISKVYDNYDSEVSSFPPDSKPTKPSPKEDTDSNDNDIKEIKPIRRTRSAPLKLLFDREIVIRPPIKDDIDMRSVHFAEDSSHELLQFIISDTNLEASTPRKDSNEDNIDYFKKYVTEIYESNVDSKFNSSSDSFRFISPSTSKGVENESNEANKVNVSSKDTFITKAKTRTDIYEQFGVIDTDKTDPENAIISSKETIIPFDRTQSIADDTSEIKIAENLQKSNSIDKSNLTSVIYSETIHSENDRIVKELIIANDTLESNVNVTSETRVSENPQGDLHIIFDITDPTISSHLGVNTSKVEKQVNYPSTENSMEAKDKLQSDANETSETNASENLREYILSSTDKNDPSTSKQLEIIDSGIINLEITEISEDSVNGVKTTAAKTLEDLAKGISSHIPDPTATKDLAPLIIKDTETTVSPSPKSLSEEVKHSDKVYTPEIKTSSENKNWETTEISKYSENIKKSILSHEDIVIKNKDVPANNTNVNKNTLREDQDSAKDQSSLPSKNETDKEYGDISSASSKHSNVNKKKRKKKVTIQSKTTKPGSGSSSESIKHDKPSTSRRRK